MKKAASIFVVLLIIAGSFFAYLQFNNSRNLSEEVVQKPVPEQTNVALAAPQEDNQKIVSADGALFATLETHDNGDGTRAYSLYSCDKDCNSKQLLFQQNLPNGEKIEVPFNAWSPDNRYLYIQKLGITPTYMVFKADGSAFGENSPYLDIASTFMAKQPDLSLKEVTGWDSTTLLHVDSIKKDGEKGPNFWYEVPSEALIQLSH